MRKEPRWTIAFLRALERTGEVRGAAEDAGVDYSTAYARRRRHADFAGAWDAAMCRHALLKEQRSQEEVAAVTRAPSTIPSSGNGPPPRPGEELIASGSQMKRAGHDRWSQAREKIFFEELAATANVKRAAQAAGVSPNAVYARRMKHPLFKAKWAAVLESGRASIEMHLVEAANKSFDPDELDTGGVEPRVSVAEAIRIVQLHGSKAQQQSIEELEPPAEEIEEIRERLFHKIERLRKREMPGMLAAGWSHDASHDCMVPPGWVMGPDYVPHQPEPPGEACEP